MWPYWIMFAFAALGVFASSSNPASSRVSGSQHLGWLLVLAIFIVMIGWRDRVGGDWYTYYIHFHHIGNMTLGNALTFSDPGYYFLNWIVAQAGGTLYSVNFFCAFFVVWGVGNFSRQQPMPWLSLLVSVPYLLIVVAMGYSRQGAALGLAMVGLGYLGRHQTAKFVTFVLLGALFHKSAVLLLPIAALSATHSRLWTFIWVGIVAAAGAYFLVLDSADRLWENYVEADYHSRGALIRVVMNAVPSVILLLFHNRLFYSAAEKKLWIWMAIFSLATVPLVMLSSTAVDRVALYFIPIQLFVFSRTPFLSSSLSEHQLMTVATVTYCAFVQLVWLNFANHADYWLPYQNYLFVGR